ncbi:polyphosphate glucokinase [bacterium BMS3Bbin01]|nr:polyphosphate glucokinase [bacterium BMS3Bbin01]
MLASPFDAAIDRKSDTLVVMEILGIDIGGSGIKGAPVDVERGVLTRERHKILTPQPATPEAVAGVVAELVTHFEWRGAIGCTFPAVVRRGVIYTAANVDQSWVGVDGESLFERATGLSVKLLNDADAAGVAEMQFGAGKGRGGVVVLLTFGTGIGSAMFADGRLMPNTELGHLEFRGGEAEHYAAARVRKEEKLSWHEWGRRVDRFLDYLDLLFSPDLFIVGGGVSRRFERFSEALSVRTEVVPAVLQNEAGIIGAALVGNKR